MLYFIGVTGRDALKLNSTNAINLSFEKWCSKPFIVGYLIALKRNPMTIRSFFFLLVLLFTVNLYAQSDCIEVERGTITANADSSVYFVELTPRRVDNAGGAWFTDTFNQGQYGQPYTFEVGCAEQLLLVFQDQIEGNCTDTVFIAPLPCSVCTQFRLVQTTFPEECSQTGPSFRTDSHNYPVTVTLNSATLTRDLTLAGPASIADFSDVPLGMYTVTATTTDGCEDTEQFVIDNTVCGSISGRNWWDLNRNGLYEPTELSTIAVTYRLFSADGSLVRSGQADGSYFIPDVPAGIYTIAISPVNRELVPTAQNVGMGTDEDRDSDINENGVAQVVVVAGEVTDNMSDAGWILNNCSARFATVTPDCGESNGSILLDTLDGQTPASYTWSHSPADTDSFTDLPAGTYTVTVTFADGCSAVNSYDLTPEVGDFSIRQEGEICTGDGVTLMISEGPDSVAVDPTGLVISWSTGESTPSIDITQAGNYAVTVSSSDGCVSVVRRFINGSPFVRIPLETSYRLDCETGTVTLELPEGFDPDLAVWVTPEGDLTGATVTLSSPGNVFLEYDTPGQNCNYSGFTEVIDPRLGDDLELAGFNADSINCSDIVLLNVLGENTVGAVFNYTWTGPDGPIDVDRKFIQVTPVGLYQVVISSECGSRTLQYDFGDNPLVCQDVSGRLFLDADAGCSLTAGDIPIPGNLVEITSVTTGEQYFAFTNAAGEWGAELPEGTYTVTAMYDELAAVGTCPPTTVTLAGGSVANVDVFIPVIEACPLLSTSINAWRLRRCFRNQANIFYENRGTGAAAGAELTLLVDPFFEDITANLPFTRDGDVLTFDLGDVPVFGSGDHPAELHRQLRRRTRAVALSGSRRNPERALPRPRELGRRRGQRLRSPL